MWREISLSSISSNAVVQSRHCEADWQPRRADKKMQNLMKPLITSPPETLPAGCRVGHRLLQKAPAGLFWHLYAGNIAWRRTAGSGLAPRRQGVGRNCERNGRDRLPGCVWWCPLWLCFVQERRLNCRPLSVAATLRFEITAGERTELFCQHLRLKRAILNCALVSHLTFKSGLTSRLEKGWRSPAACVCLESFLFLLF